VLSKTWQGVAGCVGKSGMRRKAPKSIGERLPRAGSEARWREEALPPSVGRIALKSISGCKAGEDHAGSQCPEKHPGTQGPLRGDENSWRAKETSSQLNGSPFAEEKLFVPERGSVLRSWSNHYSEGRREKQKDR